MLFLLKKNGGELPLFFFFFWGVLARVLAGACQQRNGVGGLPCSWFSSLVVNATTRDLAVMGSIPNWASCRRIERKSPVRLDCGVVELMREVELPVEGELLAMKSPHEAMFE